MYDSNVVGKSLIIFKNVLLPYKWKVLTNKNNGLTPAQQILQKRPGLKPSICWMSLLKLLTPAKRYTYIYILLKMCFSDIKTNAVGQWLKIKKIS